jgi:hypothetical protein
MVRIMMVVKRDYSIGQKVVHHREEGEEEKREE